MDTSTLAAILLLSLVGNWSTDMPQNPQTGPWTKYAQKAATKTAVPSSNMTGLPLEEQRIESAVGAQYVQGKPYQNAIATVAQNEPYVIEINDPKRFNQDQTQVKSHELIHLWQQQLPGPIKSGIPADNPKAPYDLSNIDQLRKQGHTLSTIPREQAAAIVQLYTADPSQRARLQPWISDLNTTPLSVMNPTSPNQEGINTTVRSPIPPIEAYMGLDQLKAAAAQRNPRKPGGTK